MGIAQQERIAEKTERTLIVSASEIGTRMPVGISSFGSWMLGVGTMIGSMAWLIYAPMLARSGALPTITAWTLAAFITLPLAFILAELASMFPSAGGPYVYKYIALKRLFPRYGDFLGFSTGWLYWVAMIAGVACMANGFAALVTASIWTDPNAVPVWFGAVVIGLLLWSTTVLNLRSVKSASRLNNLFTFVKLAMAAAFIALVATSKTSSLTYLVGAGQTANAGFVANVMKVLVLSITAFAGLELVGCTSAETTDPRRSIPRAIILTLSTIALIYVALCVSVCAAAPYVMNAGHNALVIPGTALQATCPAVATFIAGPIWGKLFTLGVIGSIVTCAFNSLLALSRLSYSMSETRLFPAKFSKLDHQDSVPKDALWFQFWALTIVSVGANIMAHLVPSFDPYTFLGEVFGFLYSFLAILYGVCLISLRYTEPDLLRPFRIGTTGNGLAWFMTVVTAMVYGFIAFGCAELNQILTAVALLLSGVPIYWIYRHSKRMEVAE